MVLIDTSEYPAILKNKLHQACTAIALIRALTVKVKGLFVQVKNQALQSDSMFKVPPVLEKGKPDVVMGKVPPNEYYFSGVPVKNDPVDDFDRISGDSIVGNLMASTLILFIGIRNSMTMLKVVNLRVLWDDSSGAENYKWLGIEFNWHPRILVVARSDVALLLDFRHNKCNLICLAKIEMLSPYDVVYEDQFLAFSRARADGFQFVLASKSLFLLCEVHKPRVPLLCWAHDLDNLCFIDVIRLMSSGKNEAQRYCASWDLVQNFDIAHKEPLFNFEDSLLYSSSDDEYEFPKRFKYLNLDYLCGYLNDNLAKGLGPLLHFLLSLMWATFPLELLLLAFFSYPKLVDVPIDDMAMRLKFSVARSLSQLPPFLLGKPSRRNT
ncbi:hypothetical protein Gogos_020163 [Gossypium gossypioides]|uniref:Uncharacterized protein n=1 Tax=Gossypium gossypioides TaxID=34282 RepID=A0A7J9D3V8_GOSGO|nr:hypothetical protein [Gossypium gossypioides]